MLKKISYLLDVVFIVLLVFCFLSLYVFNNIKVFETLVIINLLVYLFDIFIIRSSNLALIKSIVGFVVLLAVCVVASFGSNGEFDLVNFSIYLGLVLAGFLAVGLIFNLFKSLKMFILIILIPITITLAVLYLSLDSVFPNYCYILFAYYLLVFGYNVYAIVDSYRD